MERHLTNHGQRPGGKQSWPGCDTTRAYVVMCGVHANVGGEGVNECVNLWVEREAKMPLMAEAGKPKVYCMGCVYLLLPLLAELS